MLFSNISMNIDEKIKKSVDDFYRLTSIQVAVRPMLDAKSHNPSKLAKGSSGVYVFLNQNCCFKVGKAGSKSQARWTSHHYTLNEKVPSTLPKSIQRHLHLFKEYYPSTAHPKIESLNKLNIQSWIKGNMWRIEFIIEKEQNSPFALNLLEAIVQFNFEPIFEGKKHISPSY